MERFPSSSSESVYRSASAERDRIILEEYTPEEQAIILELQQVLTSLAYFIGKDFTIPVELNEPGGGWYWNFKENIIRIDPQDLLEKPMDYLRFVICHEAGHRRITRADFIPKDIWTQPGFSWMMNCIEDPRENNFVAEVYPRFRDYMNFSYELDAELADKVKQEGKAKLGFVPRFSKAGLEYIKQWFREANGKPFEIADDLPEEVKEVVADTLEAAQDSWLRYPSREEADQSEDLIREYAKVSYEINRDQVWPEFKKLVDQDIEDEKKQQELQDIAKEELAKQQAKQEKNNKEEGGEGDGGESNGGDENNESDTPELPQGLKDRLTPEETEQLVEAIKKAIDRAVDQAEQGPLPEGEEWPKPEPVIDLDALSDEIKQKIAEYIESLPEEVKQELAERAVAALKELEEELNRALQGKLVEAPSDGDDEEGEEDEYYEDDKEAVKPLETKSEKPFKPNPELDDFKKKLAQSLESANVYEEYRLEVLPLIDQLEQDLREIFVERQKNNWKSGYKTGKRIDIKKRIQEHAKGVPAMESRAWQKRDLPKEKDYAISLLVDLSGSMGWKIQETLKGVIVLAEALNRLSINLEITGFNKELYPYQGFGQPMSDQVRNKMSGMLEEVETDNAHYNDDGWALSEAAKSLAKQRVDQRFLVVFSDGEPAPSGTHDPETDDLNAVISKILTTTDVKLVGLGVGEGTEHVSEYYPNSIADVDVKEMAAKLADLIKEVIANYDQF